MSDDAFTALSGMPPAYFATLCTDYPNADESALRVFLALRTAARRVENVVAQWLETSGLTITKVDILHLLNAEPTGGATITRLRDFLKMTQPNVTFVVRSLERDGLVTRRGDDNDRRVTVVRITKAGKKLLASLSPRHLDAMAEAVADLPPADRKALVVMLAQIAHGFESVDATLVDPV